MHKITTFITCYWHFANRCCLSRKNFYLLVVSWISASGIRFMIKRLWVWLSAGSLSSNNSGHVVHTCHGKQTVIGRFKPSSGQSNGLVSFRLRFEFHSRSFASNFEQVSNLLCAHVNSASYPQWDGKWIVAYRPWGEGLVWLIRLHRGSSCSLVRAMDGRIMRCSIISSCQSAASGHESDSCKQRYSKYRTFTFTLLPLDVATASKLS